MFVGFCVQLCQDWSEFPKWGNCMSIKINPFLRWTGYAPFRDERTTCMIVACGTKVTPFVRKCLRFIPVYVLRYPEEVWEFLSSKKGFYCHSRSPVCLNVGARFSALGYCAAFCARSSVSIPRCDLKYLFCLLSFPYCLSNTQNGALMEGGNDRTAGLRIVN